MAWTALLVGTGAAGILAWQGAGEEGLRLVLRATARTSLLLFLGVFLASALRGRWPNRATQWLLDNRRYLGVSFAASHTVHFAAILALARMSARRLDPVVLLLGGLAYLVILAMAATSFDAAVARIGPRPWKRLHTTGIFYVWTVFLLTYAGNAGKDPKAAISAFLLLAALALRLAWRAPQAPAAAH